MSEQLIDDWNDALHEIGLSAGPALGSDLLRRYSEPHRRYHTVDHLRQVLSVLKQENADARLLVAAWFHDAVYDPLRSDNEERSAELACQSLSALGCGAADVGFISAAIGATASHKTDDPRFAVLLDADLAILGASSADYERYCANIREEYRNVPDQTFIAGRKAFLSGVLARDTIFHTPALTAQFERSARRNMRRELNLVEQKIAQQ